jgi:predicted nucleic acid-binding protein
MPGSFLDSNVLLYFASGDAAKAARAEALMEEGGTISVQVLNEMALVMRRKFHYDWERIAAVLAAVRSAFDVTGVGLGTHERALALARRYDLRIYAALIAAAALISDCDTLWSEDMHDGLVIDRRLTVRNPFSGVD